MAGGRDAGLHQAGSSKQAQTGSMHIMKCGRNDGPARDQHDIPAGFDLVQMESHRLTHEPPRPISAHCFADATAGSKTKATDGKTVGQTHQDDQPVLVDRALTSHLLEAGPITQPEASPHQSCSAVLDGQSLAALETPPFEHHPAGPGAHARAKAVGAEAFSYFGLPGSFGHEVLSS